jgi:iron complex outermembrane receptor protein
MEAIMDVSLNAGAAVRATAPLLAALLAGLALPGAARAQQTPAATVSGVVRLADGSAAPGVSVQLSDRTTLSTREARSDAQGRFTFTLVPPGSYELKASGAGPFAAARGVTIDTAGTYAADVTLERRYALNAVVVTGTRTEQRLDRVPSAVSVVGQAAIQQGTRGVSIEESLKRVPGVRVEDELGTGGRTRIVIRGTGTRANSPAGSGVRGVKVLVDGIPKNNAGGSAQDLMDIDLESMGRIEVVKGPSSALYGNQSGGVVNLLTEEPPPTPFGSFRQTVGSYGLTREHLKFGGWKGNFSYLVSGFVSDLSGYRQNSRFRDGGFHSKLRFLLDDRSDLTMVASFDRNYQQSPGTLTLAQMQLDPRQADSTFLASRVRSVVEELRLGLTYHRSEIFGHDGAEVTGYYLPRHLGPFYQIGVRIPQDFTNRGVNARYFRTDSVGGHDNRVTLGADFQNTPITTGTFSLTTGAASAETEEHASTLGVYAVEELGLLDALRLSLAGRYDWIRFSSENLTRPTAGMASRTFQRATPKVGLTYEPLTALSVYATVSAGFETPIIGELRTLPGGAFGFNDALDPQTSTNYEVGARGRIGGRLALESALYRQDIKNMINPIGTFPNNSFQNVGRVRQLGAELGVDVTLLPPLSAYGAYTYSDFTIQDFRSGTLDLSGKRLPGVPKSSYFGELRYRLPTGMYAVVDLQHSGSFFVNNANAAANPAYTVVNSHVGASDVPLGRLRLSPALGVNNIGNTDYSAFALINDARSHYFNPLPRTNAYGSVTISW